MLPAVKEEENVIDIERYLSGWEGQIGWKRAVNGKGCKGKVWYNVMVGVGVEYKRELV